MNSQMYIGRLSRQDPQLILCGKPGCDQTVAFLVRIPPAGDAVGGKPCSVRICNCRPDVGLHPLRPASLNTVEDNARFVFGYHVHVPGYVRRNKTGQYVLSATVTKCRGFKADEIVALANEPNGNPYVFSRPSIKDHPDHYTQLVLMSQGDSVVVACRACYERERNRLEREHRRREPTAAFSRITTGALDQWWELSRPPMSAAERHFRAVFRDG